MIRKIRALISTEGRTEEEAETYQAKARELAQEYLDSTAPTRRSSKSPWPMSRPRTISAPISTAMRS